MLDEGQKEFYEKGIEQFDKAVFDDKNNEIDFLTVASEEPYANKTKEEYIIYSHDKKYNIMLELNYEKDKPRLFITNPEGAQLSFINSKPETVKAIGKLLFYCAELVEAKNKEACNGKSN
ncbi:hypothetical protein A2300_03955 [Candidatus Falkowbacteria bacterium RIFOXYB2_FULL_35_7]|nr:MAG: hypothetical protein A2300_03955 [Candidatus Falkowbacteria bacterium RIFOXYB2_FULL_35_7]